MSEKVEKLQNVVDQIALSSWKPNPLMSMNRRRTLDQSACYRSFENNSFTGKISTPKAIEGKLFNKSHRLSIHSDRLLQIINSQPDQPLTVPEEDENVHQDSFLPQNNDENIPPSDHGINNRGRVDANSCQLVVEQQQKKQFQEKSARNVNIARYQEEMTPKSPAGNPLKNRLAAKIQKDLNSPSASTRLRAIKALRSPTKNPYGNFDVPYEEQEIITEEEKKSPVKPQSFEEVMKDVIVYVEVRTGVDDRSAGVKKVISQLGAKVNDKFLRDTTHVIFKDGTQSTYNKAKKWNIPAVSILWIEACKKNMKLMNPKNYPISNLERYENPELFSKVKIQKFMQPDIDGTKKNKRKVPIVETEIEKTGVKKISFLRVPRKPKDNLDKILGDFQENLMTTSDDTDDIDSSIIPFESKLLERIKNSPSVTPKAKKRRSEIVLKSVAKKYAVHDSTSGLIENDVENDFDSAVKSPVKKSTKSNLMKTPKKTASPMEKESSNTPKSSKKCKSRRTINFGYHSATEIAQEGNKEKDRISEDTELSRETSNSLKISNQTKTNTNEEEKGNSKMSIENEEHSSNKDSPTVSLSIKTRTSLRISTTPLTEKKSSSRRRTLFTPKPMEESVNIPINIKIGKNCNMGVEGEVTVVSGVNSTLSPSVKRSSRRKTFFAYNPEKTGKTNGNNDHTNNNTTEMDLEISCDNKISKSNNNNSDNKISLIANDPSPKTPNNRRMSTLLEEVEQNPCKTLPSNLRRRTIRDIQMDILERRLQNINRSAQKMRSNETLNNIKHATEFTPTASESLSLASKVNSTSNSSINEINSEKEVSSINGDQEKSDKSAKNTDTRNEKNSEELNVPKKRKLFAPAVDNFILSPATIKSPLAALNRKLTDSAKRRSRCSINNALTTEKRKKALMISSPSSSSSSQAGVNSETNTERSQVMKNELLKTQKSRGASLVDFAIGNGQPKPSQAELLPLSSSTTIPCLVYTNMHSENADFIKKTVWRLGKFQIESVVSSRTTHVVTLEPRRTINLLRGIARGLWILNYSWVEDSLRSGKWLHEEEYEVRDFSPAVWICRSERQAFGLRYRLELFIDIPPIYVSSFCKVPSSDLKELITLCGGKVVEEKNKAKYIVGEDCPTANNAICVQPQWILDSIQNLRIKKPQRYLISRNGIVRKC